MPIHYNLNALSNHTGFSVYDLARKKICGTSTCNSLYQQAPVKTGTLLKLLNFADCRLEDFLSFSLSKKAENTDRHSLDLNGMVERGVISRTAKRHFLEGLPMSLGTLAEMAEDQGVNLLNFLRIETSLIPDKLGNLKKERKVLYLCEW